MQSILISFYLKNRNNKVICVAGGVGLAPMKPIIYETLEKYPDRDIELYYGARIIKDLYDHEIFMGLAAKN